MSDSAPLQSEIEAKFLDSDHDDIRQKLLALGGVCTHPMRLMKRATIDSDFMRTGKDAYLRIRDEGDKTTMTYKQFDNRSVDGAKEIEIEVSNFDAALALIEHTGLELRSIQESKRENWQLDSVKIMLDVWPWLKPYIEIEGTSVADLQHVAQQLGLSWQDAVFGSVMAAYEAEYPHLRGRSGSLTNIAEVRFGDPLPDLLIP